jgi:hypothetical protein
VDDRGAAVKIVAAGATALAACLAAWPAWGGAAPSPAPSPGAPASDAVAAAPAAKAFRLERYDWEATPELSAALRRVVVRNDYGDIRGRRAGAAPMLVHAVIQRLGSGPDAGINVERFGDMLVVSVVLPPGRVSVTEPQLEKTAIDRVDLSVHVPDAATLVAETARGLVEARGLKADVEATSMHGDIRVQTAGAIIARSATGAIFARPGLQGRGATLIDSGSGAVRLTLPSQADFRVEVDSGGALTSEFTATDLEPSAAAPSRRRAVVQAGRGLHALAVVTDSGPVTIVREALGK